MALTDTTTATPGVFSSTTGATTGPVVDTDHQAVIGAPGHDLLADSWAAIRQLPAMTLIAIPWFFYRKMFLVGTAVLFGTIVVASEWPLAMALLAPFHGLTTRPAYRRFIRSRVAKADARSLTGSQRLDYLARAGGTSVAAACFATAIVVPLLTAILMRNGII